uniref:ABM domain-containing protein n=1 Tax=Scleropages formosus TaxID=113540 RepID=A0A8C9TY50_SCLFO
MMSCAEIITMCLQSAKHQQQQQHLFAKEPRTPRRSCAPPLSIIEDIFRRADKNGVHLQPENHCVSTFPSPQQAKMECQNVLLVQRQMLVMENNLSEFQKELEKYTIAASHHGDSLHVYVQKQTEERRVVVYEFWRDRASWTSYLQSSVSKAFQHTIIKLLEGAEQVSTILLPASWWIVKSN